MSSTRSRASKFAEDEMNDLLLKLHALLPQPNQRRNATVPTPNIFEEVCSYIRRLQREVDDLSERLSQLLESKDTTGVDVEILRNFLEKMK